MSKVKTHRGDNVVDIAIRGYGSVEGIVRLCADNGLSLDHDEAGAVSRLVDDALKQELATNRPLFPSRTTRAEEGVRTNSGQNIVDLALQETGSVEGLIAVLRENGLAATQSDIPHSTVITTRLSDVVREDIRSFYRELSYKVNTGEASAPDVPADGIFDYTFDSSFE